MTKKKITITLNENLIEELKKTLANSGFTISAKITLAIMDFLEKQQIEQKIIEEEKPAQCSKIDCRKIWLLSESPACPDCDNEDYKILHDY